MAIKIEQKLNAQHEIMQTLSISLFLGYKRASDNAYPNTNSNFGKHFIPAKHGWIDGWRLRWAGKLFLENADHSLINRFGEQMSYMEKVPFRPFWVITSWGQSYKDFYTFGQNYKCILKHENSALTQTFVCLNVRTLSPNILIGLNSS